jgi:hypothetical protein
MSYTLSIEIEDEYIRVDLYDPFMQSDIDSAMKEVLSFRQNQTLNRILCDQRQLKVSLDDITGFFTAEKFGSQPYLGTKLAIIRKQVGEERLFEISAPKDSLAPANEG